MTHATVVDTELFVAQFCPQSQRAVIALIESGIEHKIQVFPNNGSRLPKWFYDISPQGSLPVLKDGNTIVINSDAIEVHLEKSPKILKLSPSKKKQYAPIMHCKTMLEPLVAQLTDTANEKIFTLLVNLFYHELEALENSIKGPFYLGSALSWVDIHYFTILQQIPLLEYLHGIQLPASCPNIRNWMDKCSKRQSFSKASVDTKAYIYWFESLRGRGNIRPSTSVIEFTQIINNALRRGIEDLISLVKQVDFKNSETTKTLAEKFKQFDIVLREQSRCKTEVIIKEFITKKEKVPDTLHASFDKQKQILNILKTIQDKLSLHAALYSEIQKAKASNKAAVTVLEWKLAKLTKHSPKEALLEQMTTSLENFNVSLCEELCVEERTISFETAEVIFSKRELYALNRRVALLPRNNVLITYIPWVISNLMDPTQIRTFLLYYRHNIIAWLKLGLTEELWTDVRRQLEKVSKAESSMQNPGSAIVKGDAAPPVPPRKKTLPTPAEQTEDLTKVRKSMSNDAFLSTNPLVIFELMAKVLKTKIRSVMDICIASISLVGNLSTLEDALNTIFSFLTVKHQQEQNVIYPLLTQKSNAMWPLVNSYLTDKLETETQMQNAISKLIHVRMTKEITPEATRELIDEIFRALSMELHFLSKQKQIYDFLYSATQFDEQAYIIREILDESPISYVDTMLPWVVRQMKSEKQVIFVMCMKNVLNEDLFWKVLGPIRKVLPVSLCKTLLTSNNARNSL